jgi:hypothetical protein
VVNKVVELVDEPLSCLSMSQSDLDDLNTFFFRANSEISGDLIG